MIDTVTCKFQLVGLEEKDGGKLLSFVPVNHPESETKVQLFLRPERNKDALRIFEAAGTGAVFAVEFTQVPK